MYESKKQVEDAILYFAEIIGKRKNYEALIKTYPGTPRIIEMIVYELFVQKVAYFEKEHNKYYNIIYDYAFELNQKGWVDHEQNKII